MCRRIWTQPRLHPFCARAYQRSVSLATLGAMQLPLTRDQTLLDPLRNMSVTPPDYVAIQGIGYVALGLPLDVSLND